MGCVAFFTIAGCATVAPPVTVVAPDTYRITVSGANYESQADTNLKALHAANEYCGVLGKQTLFRQSTEYGAHSYSPKQEELTFVCTEPNQPVLMRASAKR